MGITFTNRNEKKIKENDDDNEYFPSKIEDIEDDGSDHPDNGSTSDSGDDYPSDDDGPDLQLTPAPNGNDKSTVSHDRIEEVYPTNNTGVEVKNETQNNSKNEDYSSQDKVETVNQ